MRFGCPGMRANWERGLVRRLATGQPMRPSRRRSVLLATMGRTGALLLDVLAASAVRGKPVKAAGVLRLSLRRLGGGASNGLAEVGVSPGSSLVVIFALPIITLFPDTLLNPGTPTARVVETVMGKFKPELLDEELEPVPFPGQF